MAGIGDGQIGHDIGASFANETVDQAVRDVLNMPAQYRDPRRSERRGAKISQTGVSGRIPEQHLPGHHLNDRFQRAEPHAVQLLRRQCAVRREAGQDGDDIGVAGDYPGMQERIPMHRDRLHAAPDTSGTGKP